MSACTPLSYGTWLSASGVKSVIEAAVNWMTEQTVSSVTELQLTKDWMNHLIILERLLTIGPALVLLDIFGVDLKGFGIRLSTLFSGVGSIEKFWAISFAEFDRLILDMHMAVDEWFNTCSSENLLWRLIDLKQKEHTQTDLSCALVFFKQRCVQEPATWLAMRDIDLLVNVLSDSRIDNVLVWAIVNNNLPILRYLTSSILNSGSKIVPPTHELLSIGEHVQIVSDITAKIIPSGARNPQQVGSLLC